MLVWSVRLTKGVSEVNKGCSVVSEVSVWL